MDMETPNFTPTHLISLPRRGSPCPSPDGRFILYTESTYSFDSHSNTAEIKLLELSTGKSCLITNEPNAGDPNWVGTGTLFAFLKAEPADGSAHLMVGDALHLQDEHYVAAKFPGPVANLKLRTTKDGSIIFAISATATPEGSLYNPQKEDKPRSSARVYDSLFVRHWASYKTANRNSIWCGMLEKYQAKLQLTSTGIVNALQGTALECPIQPFGGKDHFDIGSEGIIVLSKDPAKNSALSTKSDAYFVPFSVFTASASREPQRIETDGLQGASTGVVISPNGRSAAFLRQDDPGYEAGRNHVVVVRDVRNASSVMTLKLSKATDGAEMWDQCIFGLCWTADGESLLLSVSEKARGNVYLAQGVLSKTTIVPSLVSNGGFVSQVIPLRASSSEKKLLLTSSNFTSDERWFSLDLGGEKSSRENVFKEHIDLSSTGSDRVSEIWFEGAEGFKVHAWVLKPENFQEGQTYPTVFIIHGGPQYASHDAWGLHFSPAIFAAQGYVVILPNVTGSIGFGQHFCDRIEEQWGGHPYEDLVCCFEYVNTELTFADCDRAICFGPSWGGYMANWIQGHPLGRRFKALISDCGIFSTPSRYTADELFDSNRDFGGPLSTHRHIYDQWDPSRYTGEWATPHLIIHNDLDFRCPITEGIAAFNVLQQRGVPSRFVNFPDEGHVMVESPENLLRWYEEVLAWMAKYIGT